MEGGRQGKGDRVLAIDMTKLGYGGENNETELITLPNLTNSTFRKLANLKDSKMGR